MIRQWSFLFALACFGTCPASVQAQLFPSKPVTIVVAYAPGGATDVIARAVAQRLAEAWRRPAIIENKAGANTQIAAAYVAKSAPDGYTLLATADATFTANPFLYRALSYDPIKDFVPVSGFGYINETLVAHPSLPVHTINELVALAKGRPGELAYASLGIGSAPHLSMELLKSKAGLQINAVQYKGAGPALTDVTGGHVPMMFINVGLMEQPWKAGQLRPLGVGSKKRLAAFPELPTIAESVPGFVATYWFGLFAPAATPPDVVREINAAVQHVLTDPEFAKTFLAPNFYDPFLGSPEEFAQTIRSDTEKWAQVIKDAKLSAEE